MRNILTEVGQSSPEMKKGKINPGLLGKELLGFLKRKFRKKSK